jgi:FkbM family methyltransferase
MKKKIKKLISTFGYEIKLKSKTSQVPIGSDMRPVGSMKYLLEDLKFRGLECNSIMDVGASRALWSRMAKGIFPESKFYLIEPQLEVESYLIDFCKTYKDSVYFLNGAGSKKEILTLTIWDDLSGSSLIYEEKNELLKSGKQRKIKVIKIDNLIEEEKLDIPEIMKLDIQGFELEALKGASKTFGITEVYILEVSLYSFGAPVINEVISFMLERNYVIYDFPGFLRRPLDGSLYQCDICFVKKASFLRQFHHWND